MPQLTFETEHVYPDDIKGILLHVELRAVSAVRLLASLDTGAAHCLFQSEYAEAIGLQLKDGAEKRFSTPDGGTITGYGHYVTLETLGHAVDSLIYFTDHTGFSRNVLGRHGWLHWFMLGLIHYESRIFLSPLGQ